MIVEESVFVRIYNGSQRNYYIDAGYAVRKGAKCITVPVHALPPYSNTVVTAKCSCGESRRLPMKRYNEILRGGVYMCAFCKKYK
jgi:hypothetical protein